MAWAGSDRAVEGNRDDRQRRSVSAGVAAWGSSGLALASGLRCDEPHPRPRPGLTAQQTKEAVKLAQGAMVELRKKTEGASAPGADLREYVVGVELLSSNESAPAPPKDRRLPPRATHPGPSRKRRRRTAEREKHSGRRGPAGDRDVVSLFRRHHGLFDRRPGNRPGRQGRGRPAPAHAPVAKPSSKRPRRWPARKATR